MKLLFHVSQKLIELSKMFIGKRKWEILFASSLYFIIVFLTYGKLPLTFFQQDEWAVFGNYLYWDKATLGWFDRLFIYEQFTHIVPLSNLFSYLQFKFFSLNFGYYALISIGIQFINSILVYILFSKLIGNKIVAFLASIIFLVNAIPHQAITWIATTIGTAGSATFVLLSLIFFIDFINGNKIKKLLISVSFLFTSFLFKETSLFLVFFFPIMWFFYKKEKNLKQILVMISPYIGIFILYVLFRLIFLFISPVPPQDAELTQPDILVYVYRIFTAPLKSLAQSFIPLSYLLMLANNLVILGYPYFIQGGAANPYVSETIGSDIISYSIASILIIICLFFIKLFHGLKKEKLSIAMLCSFIFIALTSFPLMFIPGSGGYYSLIDGRHLYISGIFSSLLLATIFYGLLVVLRSFKRAYFLVGGLVFLFIIFNIFRIRRDLNQQRGLAFTRLSILNSITTSYPKLSSKNILYVESDTPYYGLPYGDNILPFQSGFGQTLLVWYNQRGDTFPACFFKGQFLYIIQSQGYRECEGRGFGYFRKMDDLKKAFKEDIFKKEDVIAFSYISSKNLLKNITKQMQEELSE